MKLMPPSVCAKKLRQEPPLTLTFEALTYHYSVGEDDEKLPYSDSDT